MSSLPYIQKLTCQCSKVGSKVVQDRMTNLSGKLTCSCKKGGHASVDIGWWRIARGCLWLCCMLIISHRQGGASFEEGFVTVFGHSSVATNVKLHNYYVHIAECRWAYLLPFNFLFLIFSDLSFYAKLQKLPFSKAYCKAHKYFFNSQSSCGTACGCGHLFVCGIGFFVSRWLWFYLFEWQVASSICVLSVLFVHVAHILISSDQGEANNVVLSSIEAVQNFGTQGTNVTVLSQYRTLCSVFLVYKLSHLLFFAELEQILGPHIIIRRLGLVNLLISFVEAFHCLLLLCILRGTIFSITYPPSCLAWPSNLNKYLQYVLRSPVCMICLRWYDIKDGCRVERCGCVLWTCTWFLDYTWFSMRLVLSCSAL